MSRLSKSVRQYLKAITLAIAVLLLAACQTEKTESDYLASARAYLDAADFDSAIIELKNALQINPDNPESRLLLGELHLKYGAAANAEKELLKAGVLAPEEEKTLPLLGQALMRQGRHEELQELPVDEGLDDETRASLLASQGLAALAQGRYEAADELIERAIATSPEATYALMAKAQLLYATDRNGQAHGFIEKVFEIDPDNHAAWSLLGDIQQRQGDSEQAERSYTRALLNNPDNFNLSLKRAYMRIYLEDFTGAQQDIDAIRDLSPLHPGVNYLQGLIHFHHRQLAEAKAAFELTLMNRVRHLTVIYYMAVTNYMLKQFDDAEVYAREYYFRNTENDNIRLLLARLRYDKKDFDTAEKLIRPIYSPQTEDLYLLNFMANTLMAQGKTDEGIAILEKVARLNPDSAAAQMRLGRGFLAAGQQDNAIKQIEIAVEMNPQFQRADALLIIHYIRIKEYDKALEKTRKFRDNNPDSPLSYNLLGRALQARGQKDESIAAFKQARALAPGDPDACHKLASFALVDQDYELARSYYQEVLQYHENYEATLLKLSAMELIEGDTASMEQHLLTAIEAHPGSVKPRVVLARYYLGAGRPGKARSQFNGLDEIQLRRPEVLKTITLTHLAEQNWADARFLLTDLQAVQPDSAESQYMYARAFIGQGYDDRARKALNRSVALDPDYFPPHLELAKIYLREGKMQTFRDELATLRRLAPQNESVLKLEAIEAQHRGDAAAALHFNQRLAQLYPGTHNMLLLARQLWRMGEQDRALAIQQDWLREHPSDIIARTSLASTLLRQGRKNAAVDQYESVLRDDPDNLVALQKLAWHLRKSDPKQALQYAERAVELSPESAVLTDTLAVVLLLNGDKEKARRYSARAIERRPDDPTMRYHNALILADSGDRYQATRLLDKLLAEDIDFPERSDAAELLASLKNYK